MLTTHKEVINNEVGSKNNVNLYINHLFTYLVTFFLFICLYMRFIFYKIGYQGETK
jgi:hypothetical protein